MTKKELEKKIKELLKKDNTLIINKVLIKYKKMK